MTDAQQFIDWAQAHLTEAAAELERYLDGTATQLRQFLSADLPFTPRLIPRPPPPPPTAYQAANAWISRNRAITAAVIAFALTGSVGSILYLQQSRSRKRRAARSASGARIEVVVLAGNIHSPVASNLALDLERRGYIVYAVSDGVEDERFVRSLQRVDLLPLQLDLTNAYTARKQLASFTAMLDKKHHLFEEAPPHKLLFKGLVLIPDTSNLPMGTIDSIASDDWSDALNAKVLNTITTTHLFLPLLKQHSSKLLLLMPSVTASLLLPGYSVENTINGALNAFVATLAAEMESEGVSVTQFKLGDLDIPSSTARQKRKGAMAPRHKATPLRKLHHGVFDVLSSRKPARTWHVGKGSLAYDIVGSIASQSMISWMMDLNQREQMQTPSPLDRMQTSKDQGNLAVEHSSAETPMDESTLESNSERWERVANYR